MKSKFLRKRFSFMMAAMFILTQCFLPISTGAEINTLLPLIDFETEDHGFVVNQGGEEHTSTAADPADGYNRVYKSYTEGLRTYNGGHYTFDEPLEGRLLIELNYSTSRPTVNNDQGVRFYDNQSFHFGQYLFEVGVSSSNYQIRTYFNSSETKTYDTGVAAAAADQWAHFTIIYNTETKTVEKWYIDGVSVLPEGGYVLPTGSRLGKIKHVGMTVRATGILGSIYMDNLQIRGLSSTETNIPPIHKHLIKTQSVVEGTPATVDLTHDFFDIEGDAITLSTETPGAFIDNGVLTYTPQKSGKQFVTVTASDGNGSWASQIPFYGIESAKPVSLFLDFEGDAIGENAEGFTAAFHGTNGAGNLYVSADLKDPYNQVLYSKNTTVSTYGYNQYTLPSYTEGKLLIQLNYYNTHTNLANEGAIGFYNNDPNYDPAKPLLRLNACNGNFRLSVLNEAGGTSGTTNFDTVHIAESSRWYHFTLVLDTEAETLEWYIDGEPVSFPVGESTVQTLPLSDYIGSRPLNLKHFTTINRSSSGNISRELYFDNIAIQSIEEDFPPVALNLIKTQTLLKGETLTLDLSNEFFDLDSTETLTLSASKGTIDENNILTYTPQNIGTQELTLTATNSKGDSVERPLTVVVKDWYTLTVTQTPGGTVTGVGTNQIVEGDIFTVIAIPDTGYQLVSMKYDGNELASGQLNGFAFIVPELTKDTLIEVEFAFYEEGFPTALRESTGFFSPIEPETFDYQGKSVTAMTGIAFASAKPQYGDYLRNEYGMLLTTIEDLPLEDFQKDKENVLTLAGTALKPEDELYGIRFFGEGVEAGKVFYTRPYAVFKSGEQIRTLYGAVQKVQIGNSNDSQPEERNQLKVLAIGNSFSSNATAYLPDIAEAGGVDLILGNLSIGGASLELHATNATEEKPDYTFYFTGEEAKSGCTIKEALEKTDWDIITFQQASHLSGYEDTYQEHLNNLSAYVKLHAPGATQVIHQTWAYAEESSRYGEGSNYYVGASTPEGMFALLKAAYDKAADDLDTFVIPSGEAIRQALIYKPQLRLHSSDHYHLGVNGCYVAAATWYESLTGKSILENSWKPSFLSEEDWQILKFSAHIAVQKYR